MENKIKGLRFIIGSGCNYNCFYCHHEGYYKKDKVVNLSKKIKMLKDYAEQNNINSISITGGEPFMYFEELELILDAFNEEKYTITLNTNLSLLETNLEKIKNYNKIEFHVNLSSLNLVEHKNIVKASLLDNVLKNLQLLKGTHHKVCLNIPALKEYNDNELKYLFDYAKENNFIPRFLVLLPMDDNQKQNVMSVDEIINVFENGKLEKKYSYGRYNITSDDGDFEIVKCLCADMECETCKKETYMHITPELNIKYCMLSDDEVIVDYSSFNNIEKSFEESQKRLKLII